MAKIESQSAVREIDAMIGAADVILIARGDLGIECPMEELPIIQRRIVKRCLRFGKPVIVATQIARVDGQSSSADPCRNYRRRQCGF